MRSVHNKKLKRVEEAMRKYRYFNKKFTRKTKRLVDAYLFSVLRWHEGI